MGLLCVCLVGIACVAEKQERKVIGFRDQEKIKPDSSSSGYSEGAALGLNNAANVSLFN